MLLDGTSSTSFACVATQIQSSTFSASYPKRRLRSYWPNSPRIVSILYVIFSSRIRPLHPDQSLVTATPSRSKIWYERRHSHHPFIRYQPRHATAPRLGRVHSLTRCRAKRFPRIHSPTAQIGSFDGSSSREWRWGNPSGNCHLPRDCLAYSD